MRKLLLGLCLIGGGLSLGSSPVFAQVPAAGAVELSSGGSCAYDTITTYPNGGIRVTCSVVGGVVTVPGKPTGVTASPLDATSVRVTFAAPASNGGGAISAYKAVCTSGSGVASAPVSNAGAVAPITVGSLITGQTYTCTVAAINSADPLGTTSDPSAATPALAAASVPGKPTSVTATPIDGTSVRVTFAAPALDGGGAITAYKAVCMSGSGVASAPVSNAGAVAPITVGGLTTGQTYTCTVAAINSADPLGTASDPSAATPALVAAVGCGVIPAGTTVVNWTAYNNPGNTIETGMIAAASSKAFKFTANNVMYPIGTQVKTETSTTTGGSNRADITIASCPGVFTSPQAGCVLVNAKLSNKLTSFDPAAPTYECTLQNGQDYYVNIRPNALYPNVAKVLVAQPR